MKFSSIILLAILTTLCSHFANAQCLTNNLEVTDTLVVKDPIDSTQNLLVFGKNVKEIKLLVYSRMGKKIFESSSSIINANATTLKKIDTGWDGRYQGKRLSEGMYIYMIEAQCADKEHSSIRKSGTIILTN